MYLLPVVPITDFKLSNETVITVLPSTLSVTVIEVQELVISVPKEALSSER